LYFDRPLEHVCLARGRNFFLLKPSLRDDDEEFLYGDSELKESSLSKIPADHIVAPVPTTIPFGKAEPADDDLFPPIRPPADATAALKTDAAEEMEDAADADADADADAVTGDGSSDAEESDEVSSSALK
jgi:hypothetical protein